MVSLITTHEKLVDRLKKPPKFPNLKQIDKRAVGKVTKWLYKRAVYDGLTDDQLFNYLVETFATEFDKENRDDLVAYPIRELYQIEDEHIKDLLLQGDVVSYLTTKSLDDFIDNELEGWIIFNKSYDPKETRQKVYIISEHIKSNRDVRDFVVGSRAKGRSAHLRVVTPGHILFRHEALKRFVTEGPFKFKKSYQDELIGILELEALNKSRQDLTSRTLATFRDDKIYQDDELNHQSFFNWCGVFRKIEVDTQTSSNRVTVDDKTDKQIVYKFDRERFRSLEEDFRQFYMTLPQPKNKAELKFRKLARHKADGLYCPMTNIIAIDVRTPNSFIHEYGHYLDYKLTDHILSQSKPFLNFVWEYRDNLKLLQDDFEVSDVDFRYYITPTEVFARSFELYVSEYLGFQSEHLTNPNFGEPEYYALGTFKEELFDYFTNHVMVHQSTMQVLPI